MTDYEFQQRHANLLSELCSLYAAQLTRQDEAIANQERVFDALDSEIEALLDENRELREDNAALREAIAALSPKRDDRPLVDLIADDADARISAEEALHFAVGLTD